MKLHVGGGALLGRLRREKVCLGEDDVLCTTTSFVSAVKMTDEPFNLLPYDGILGLGMLGSSVNKRFNFMGNLAGLDALKHNRFAVWLSFDSDGEDSEITFGTASDNRTACPDVVWLPLSRYDTGMWQARMNDVSVDGTELKLCGRDGCQAAFDTGTSVIAGPKALIVSLLAVLNIASDCTNFDGLPMLGFTFDKTTFNLEPADYVRKTRKGCFHQFLAVSVPPPEGPLVLLGEPFLRRYYTVYDAGSLQVGVTLAKHKEPPRLGETSSESAERLIVRQGVFKSAASPSDPQATSLTEFTALPATGQSSWATWALNLLGDA